MQTQLNSLLRCLRKTFNPASMRLAVFQRCLIIALVSIGLTACSDGGSGATESEKQKASTMLPSDPDLASLYSQTCKSCHAVAIGGAPLTGSKSVWQSRLAQGEDVLLDHTINGYKGMPPLGACTDCGEEEFRALIRFMAGVE